jgi:lipocalin
MMPASTMIACTEKRKLLQAFAEAVSDYNRMHSQVIAVLNGEEDFPFEEEIAGAAKVREQAKYAVLKHQAEHGC